MAGEKNIEYLNEGRTPATESKFERNKNRIQMMLLITIGILIASILFIVIEMPLIAGTCVILGACLIYMVSRKVFWLLAEITRRMKDLGQSNEKQGAVISDFSHKIREPLNNLVIISDLLMKCDPDKKQEELLETFVASNNNMVNTVNELTMETAGNINTAFRKHIKFNLLSTIQNTIELYNLKDKTNIEFILDCNDLQDFEFIGDPIILKQIYIDLFNTIENQEAENKTIVTINIIKPQQSLQECVVEMKINVNRNLLLIDYKKSSIGLAAKLIASNNGTFNQRADSDNSVLNIFMPFARVLEEPKKIVSSQRIEELKKKTKTIKYLKDINVLLVEDNIINQKITLLTLSPLVKSIDAAINGKEALDMMGKSQYDLILMDIQMPVMTGLVAAEKIRALEASTNSHTPIIAITANAMLGDKERCISSGIDDYISKPFQPSVLIEKIKKLLETV